MIIRMVYTFYDVINYSKIVGGISFVYNCLDILIINQIRQYFECLSTRQRRCVYRHYFAY